LPTAPPPADQQESAACTFTLALDSNGNATQTTGRSNTYWFGDAILIKQYNGADHNYISWNSTTWGFNKANTKSTNYVGDVCTCTNQSGAGCQHSHP
jgi:hypothetical protein